MFLCHKHNWFICESLSVHLWITSCYITLWICSCAFVDFKNSSSIKTADKSTNRLAPPAVYSSQLDNVHIALTDCDTFSQQLITFCFVWIELTVWVTKTPDFQKIFLEYNVSLYCHKGLCMNYDLTVFHTCTIPCLKPRPWQFRKWQQSMEAME